MRNFLLFIGLLCTLLTNAQTSKERDQNDKKSREFDDYYAKSVRQKRAGWASLGLGVGFGTGGVLMLRAANKARSNITEKKSIANTLLIGSGTSFVASIGFFVSSAGNRNYAMSLALKNETAPSLSKGNYAYHTIPSFSFRLAL